MSVTIEDGFYAVYVEYPLRNKEEAELLVAGYKLKEALTPVGYFRFPAEEEGNQYHLVFGPYAERGDCQRLIDEDTVEDMSPHLRVWRIGDGKLLEK